MCACRLYGFKVHPMAYQMQYQAAANFKAPLRQASQGGPGMQMGSQGVLAGSQTQLGAGSPTGPSASLLPAGSLVGAGLALPGPGAVAAYNGGVVGANGAGAVGGPGVGLVAGKR